MSGIMNLLLAAKAGAAPYTVIQTFLATGTWTAPTGVTEVEYLVVAGGGSGGNAFGGEEGLDDRNGAATAATSHAIAQEVSRSRTR